MRSERDQKIIVNLRQKMYNYAADLTKTEKQLVRARERIVQLGEYLENHIWLARETKQNYEEEVNGLRKYLVILENEMGEQVKDFGIEREHFYNLLNQLERNAVDIQRYKDHAQLLVEARDEHITLMRQDKKIKQFRIREIADYTTKKCNDCEQMTKPCSSPHC